MYFLKITLIFDISIFMFIVQLYSNVYCTRILYLSFSIIHISHKYIYIYLILIWVYYCTSSVAWVNGRRGQSFFRTCGGVKDALNTKDGGKGTSPPGPYTLNYHHNHYIIYRQLPSIFVILVDQFSFKISDSWTFSERKTTVFFTPTVLRHRSRWRKISRVG